MSIFKVNMNLRLLSKRYKNNKNLVSIHKNNTFEHEYCKFIISYTLKKMEIEFCTEAIFENGCRADVFDLSRGIAFEIIHTEKEESIEVKKIKYPVRIVELTTTKILDSNKEELINLLS